MLSRILPFRRRGGPSTDSGAGPSGEPQVAESDLDATVNGNQEEGEAGDVGNYADNISDGQQPEQNDEEQSAQTIDEPHDGTTSPVLVTMDMRLDGWVSGRSAASANETFHLFTSLPYDLRRRIWRTSMERYRIVNITHEGPKVERSTNQFGKGTSGVHWHMFNKIPAIFATCQESRHEALSFYRIHLPGMVYMNPEWDIITHHVNNYAATFPIDAFLCSDMLAYDPLGVGVVHFGRKGSWIRQDGAFEKPLSPLYPLEVIKPLKESLKNLRSWTEVYSLHPPGEWQESGSYKFPHWNKREGYFEKEDEPIKKSAYVLPANSQGYETVLRGLGDMLGGIVSADVKEKAVVATFHIMPTARNMIVNKENEPDDGRIFVGQYGKKENMMV
jgi:2EXR family